MHVHQQKKLGWIEEMGRQFRGGLQIMKFAVTRDADYIAGHLRYGHLEGVVEVESEAELRRMVDDESIYDYLDLVVDDYEVDDVDYGNNPVRYEVIE